MTSQIFAVVLVVGWGGVILTAIGVTGVFVEKQIAARAMALGLALALPAILVPEAAALQALAAG